MRLRIFLLVGLLGILDSCNKSKSSVVIEEDEDDDTTVPCDIPIIYQQLVHNDGTVVRVLLPLEYHGWVSTSDNDHSTHVSKGGEWKHDYHGRRHTTSVTVEVVAEYDGDDECPVFGEEIEEVSILTLGI